MFALRQTFHHVVKLIHLGNTGLVKPLKAGIASSDAVHQSVNGTHHLGHYQEHDHHAGHGAQHDGEQDPVVKPVANIKDRLLCHQPAQDPVLVFIRDLNIIQAKKGTDGVDTPAIRPDIFYL